MATGTRTIVPGTPMALPVWPPVAFGRLAVPGLFSELQRPHCAADRLRVLASVQDLLHHPEPLQQAVRGGFLQQLKVLLEDEDPSVRSKTCEVLQVVGTCSLGRQAVLDSCLLPALCQLLEDSRASCRTSSLRVLDVLAQLPAGAGALLTLVPGLVLKLKEAEQREEEEEVLLLSIISCCARLDPLPALGSHAVSILRSRLTQPLAVRREAAAAMMALSVPEEGKRQLVQEDVLPLAFALLTDQDIQVQTNAAGVLMNTSIITPGKNQCLGLGVVPVLLHLLSETPQEESRTSRKALVLYCLQTLSALAEAPAGRRLLLQQLPLLVRRTDDVEEDPEVQRAAWTAVKVITWTPESEGAESGI